MSTFLSRLMILRPRYRIINSPARMNQRAIPKSQGHTGIFQRRRRRNKPRGTIPIENRNEPKRIQPPIMGVSPAAGNIFICLGSTTNNFRKVHPPRAKCRNSELVLVLVLVLGFLQRPSRCANTEKPDSSAISFAFQGIWLRPPAKRESGGQNDVARLRNGPFRKAAVKASAPE
jgi:hypothetical protein